MQKTIKTASKKLFVIASTGTHASINTTALVDKNLSYKAKGIHAFIRTCRQGELVTFPSLLEASKDGREAVNSGVKELLLQNYLYKVNLRNSVGQISATVYVSFPTPTKTTHEDLIKAIEEGEKIQPLAGNPLTGNPHCGDDKYYPSGNTFDLNYNYYTNTSVLVNNNNLNSAASRANAKTNLEIDEIIQYWNSLPGLTTHKRGEQFKTYRTIVETLQKQLRHHSILFIKQAIKNYSEILALPNTTIRTNKPPFKVGLHEFFKFDYYTDKQRSKKGHPLREIESWFIECKKGIDYLKTKFSFVPKDEHPITTKELIKQVEKIGIKNGDPSSLFFFVAASKKIHALLAQSKHNLPKAYESWQLVDDYIRYLQGISEKHAIHLGYLNSDKVWDGFIEYLSSSNILLQ